MITSSFQVRLVVALAMLAAVQLASCTETAGQQFWSEFRQAVIAADEEKIVSITRFPFVVRGPVDSDPVRQYDREGFLAIYEQLLEQDVYLPSKGVIVRHSMRELVLRSQELPADSLVGTEHIRFHQFEFQRLDGRWRFTRAYLDE